MTEESLLVATLAALFVNLSVGAAIGMVFGPLRLAGTDFSKWFADPGEISEGSDHTWIGMMKWTALHTGRWLLGATVAALAVVAAWSFIACWVNGPSTREVVTCDLCGLVATALTWSGWGVLAGIIMSQSLVEVAWRRGLGETEPRPTRRLTRHRGVVSDPPPPLAKGRRRLIICCDGTWNSPVQQRETNVVALLRAIKPMSGPPDHIPQIVLYHLGVGTGNFLDRLIGGGAGVGLSNSVKACFGFLVDNYQAGDEILLFGFSRGAYVVRSVAGMIGSVGLLQKKQMHRFLEAWDYYTLSPTERRAQKERFERVFQGRVEAVGISCVGVWDTVGALGIPGTRFCSQAYAFHETKLGDHVRHAFQAMAIDERRGNFQPAIWAREHNDPHRPLEQMWFPGVHSNIGGGYDEHGLADAALLWMLSRIAERGLLDVDRTIIKESLARYRGERYAQGRLQDSRTRFWKAIASPIPRPVCITDDSEKVHESARERMVFDPGDPYTGSKRRDWLGTVTIEPRTGYETDPIFNVGIPGEKIIPSIEPKSGMCMHMMRRLFGEV